MRIKSSKSSRCQLLVLTESEARKKCLDLFVASLGAQREEKPGCKITARFLFDGTHGLCVNSRTRLRDQERAPIAADLLKRTMWEKAKLEELTFALTADVSEAHRQVPIHPDDWHLLGCQVIPGGEVLINTVGTFGIASAFCYWSRVVAAVGRMAQHLVVNTATTWHMLVIVEDYLRCVGFELVLRSICVGISSRRAEWFARWNQKIAGSDTVNMASFEEELGRIMFVAGALEHERPFLGLLYKFISIHPRDSTRKIPPDVKFILRYLSNEITKQRHFSADCRPRVDAQASASRTGVGGMVPGRREWLPEPMVDQLANGIVDAFGPEKRLHVSVSALSWSILQEALEAGREAERAFQNMRSFPTGDKVEVTLGELGWKSAFVLRHSHTFHH